MNGSQRAARRLFLLDWYARAQPLFDPPEKRFCVISARKEDPEVRAVSARWLLKNFRGRAILLHLLKVSRTTENVVRYKAATIAANGYTDFTEDNLQVIRGIKRILPTCRAWWFNEGERSAVVISNA